MVCLGVQADFSSEKTSMTAKISMQHVALSKQLNIQGKQKAGALFRQ